MENTTRMNRGIIIVLLIMWGLLTIRIGAPWFGHHDTNGVVFMTTARNYELYGASELHLLPLLNYEIPAQPEDYNFYLHHPPMISWVLALAGGGVYVDRSVIAVCHCVCHDDKYCLIVCVVPPIIGSKTGIICGYFI